MIDSRYKSFYGAQKSMVTIIRVLDKKLYDVKVLTTNHGKLKDELHKLDIDVDVIKLGEKANVFGKQVLNYSILNKFIVAIQILAYNLKLISYIRKNYIDIIYANDLRALIYTCIATKLMRKKLILYIREEISYNPLTRIGLFFSNKVITIAKGVLKDIPKNLISKYDYKLINIYTGFNFEKVNLESKKALKKILNINENKVVIGYVGSINTRKGLDILIKGLSEIKNKYSNITLLVAGDVTNGHEEYWRGLQKQIVKDELNLMYLGYCEDMNTVYSIIDILILPSRSEGLPRTVIEGMGYQLPVIATDVGGTREIIANDDLGILIPKNSVKDLVLSLERLINAPKTRKEMGFHAKRYVEKKFSEEGFTRRINDLFSKI